MLLAEAAVQEPSKFHTFDVFMIMFTILILVGVFRLLRAPQKNKFAIAFGVVSLLVFAISDYAMIMNWLS
jgi:4-amino-4-deoxy-L-arabinose transferase-like glycosyltransferase